MNIYVLLSIFASIIYLLAAAFVYFKSKLNPINKSYVIMLLCVSLWNVDVAGILSAPTPEIADLWGKIFRNGLLFIPPTFLHFTILFTHSSKIPKRAKKILWTSYLASCFFAGINWTPFLTSGVRESRWGYHIQSGPLYPYFILQFIICIFLSIFYLIRGFIRADNYQRQRFKYFFMAMSIGVTIGSLNFIPMFGGGIYPFGTIAVMASLMVMTYSLGKHRLMDTSIFMAKAMGYILTITMVGIPGILILLLLEDYFLRVSSLSFSISMVMVGVALALVFQEIKEWVNQAMHHIIVRDKYKYHEVLDEFSRRLVTIVDLNRLLQMLADTIEKGMEVKQISIFLFDAEKQAFRRALIRNSPEVDMIKISDPGIQYFLEKKEALLRSELEETKKDSREEELLKIMGQFNAEVCLPLIYMNKVIGFINLGQKTRGEIYYAEDLNLLTSLANQVAIAIENATLYENLKRSQGIMRRADRLASLGTLIASLAHEIRNPLVSIKTFTQLLPERIDDEEFRNYFLKVASGEIDRLTSLINELLGFARPSEPRPQGEDINSIIDKMEVLVSSEARKKNITISKKYASDLPQVKVDPEQIKQVLLNILLNAIQAIKGEGQIGIETRIAQVPVEDKIEPFLQIEIRDTGAGIPQENLERIFDPFFSTRVDGSGLGLAISHQIIHEHGGFINVESEVGKGTSFKVHLPLDRGGKIGAHS